MQSKKIISFFAANPQDTSKLALDEEARDIQAKIRASDHRTLLELRTRWAVRPDDLLQALNEDNPDIVHFSGHGNGFQGIFLHDEDAGTKVVSAIGLKRLFTALKSNIRLVVLNACFSRLQAEAIVEVIDCVISMNTSIGDTTARLFAASFYRGLGFGHSVQNAFDQGLAAIALSEHNEVNTPELLTRHGLNAEQVFLFEEPFSLKRLSNGHISPPQLLSKYTEKGKYGIGILTLLGNLTNKNIEVLIKRRQLNDLDDEDFDKKVKDLYASFDSNADEIKADLDASFKTISTNLKESHLTYFKDTHAKLHTEFELIRMSKKQYESLFLPEFLTRMKLLELNLSF